MRRSETTNGPVLGWSPPVPKGKPVVRPNDERPLLRPYGNDLGNRGGHDDVKYFASGRNSADRESVADLLKARRYPRPKAEE